MLNVWDDEPCWRGHACIPGDGIWSGSAWVELRLQSGPRSSGMWRVLGRVREQCRSTCRTVCVFSVETVPPGCLSCAHGGRCCGHVCVCDVCGALRVWRVRPVVRRGGPCGRGATGGFLLNLKVTYILHRCEGSYMPTRNTISDCDARAPDFQNSVPYICLAHASFDSEHLHAQPVGFSSTNSPLGFPNALT